MVVVSSKIIAIVQTGKLKKKNPLIYTFNTGYKTAHLLYASLFKALNLFNFSWSRSSPAWTLFLHLQRMKF